MCKQKIKEKKKERKFEKEFENKRERKIEWENEFNENRIVWEKIERSWRKMKEKVCERRKEK